MTLRLVRVEQDREAVLRAIARSIISGQTTCVIGEEPLVGIPHKNKDLIAMAIGFFETYGDPNGREWFVVPEFSTWEAANEYAETVHSCERKNYA